MTILKRLNLKKLLYPRHLHLKPNLLKVTTFVPGFLIPRIAIHICSASILTPTPEGDKYTNSVETYNIEIKKNEQDYFNHRQTHYDRMNPEYLPKNTCNFTQFKNKLDDSSLGPEMRSTDPSLLTQFRNNPYTQSLESFAY